MDRSGKTTIIIDIGSSSHISNSTQIFTKMPDAGETNVTVANKNKLISYRSGEAEIHIEMSDTQIKQITV